MQDQAIILTDGIEAIPSQRREQRIEREWIGTVRLQNGTEFGCTVKDVSRSGARLGLPENIDLPEGFMLRVLGFDFVCQVKLAWRRGNYVGVTILRIGKLPQPRPVTSQALHVELGHENTSHRAIGTRKSKISAF